MQPFPKSWDIIRPAIQDMMDQQKNLWKLNLLGAVGTYALVPLLMAPIGFLVFSNMLAPSPVKLVLTILLGIVIGLAFLALAVWYSNHYMLRALGIVRKETAVITPKASMEKVPGAFLVAILQGLATMLVPFLILVIFVGGNLLALVGSFESPEAMQGLNLGLGALGSVGLLASICLAVFVGVRLQFSSFSFLDRGTRGLDALKASWKLSDGRFWKILGVLFIYFLVYFAASIVMGILIAIVNGIFGGNWFGSVLTTLLNAVFISFLFLPASMFFSVRLYEAVRHLPALTAPTPTTSS